MSEQITVLADESLGGIEREYREVKRKAAVGERIKVIAISPHSRKVGSVNVGEVFTVGKVDAAGDIWEVREREFSGIISQNWRGLHEYVVLEPSDIVHINGERFRMVDRKAAVGKRVIVISGSTSEAVGCIFRHEIGDIGVVDEVLSDRACFNGWYLVDGDYRVLEPVKSDEDTAPTPLSTRPATFLSSRSSAEQAAENIAALTAQNVALAAQVQTLETRLNALYDWHKRTAIDLRVAREDIVLIEEGVSDDIKSLESRVAALERFNGEKSVIEAALENARNTYDPLIASQKSPQQIRDEIVERAKADVKKITEDIYGDINGTAFVAYGTPGHMRVNFVIKRDKRTVVALVGWRYQPGVRDRGIAKCAPNDVFNAHIGRAIALRRALGLEVPAEYLSVPGPTEVRVGDVVGYGSRIATVALDGRVINTVTHTFLSTANKCGAKIIDDTREGAELSASSSAKGVAA